jgi:predicted ATP-binding protein involved in virulence
VHGGFMLKEFYVKKLFGRFNYPFSFKEGGVTILTGPNGFGKTTILNIINAISNSDLKFFFQLDFEEIELRFDNKNSTKITKSNQKISIDGIDVPIPTEKELKYLSSRFNNYPFIVDNEIVNYHLSESFIYDSDEYITRVTTNKNSDSIYLRLLSSKKEREKLSQKLIAIQKYCGKVRMISEQRLLDKKNDKDTQTVIDVITQLPNKLKSEISKVTEEYSKVANNLDSSYPKRLLTAKAGLSDISEYELRLIEANSRFKKLSEYNLVDLTLIDYKNYDDRYSTALMIYFDDFTLKYKVFEELIDKLDH